MIESRNKLKTCKSRDCAVSTVLTELCAKSQGVMPKNKNQYLVDHSTLKLDYDNLFENENYAADCSPRYEPVAEFPLWTEDLMADISQVVTMSSKNGIIEQSTRRK